MSKFQIITGACCTSGYIFYNAEEFSFDAYQVENTGITSVLIDDLSLTIDATGKVLYVSGLCPHTRWEEASLELPHASDGELHLLWERAFQPGVSIRLTPPGQHLPTFVDRDIGWVMIRRGVGGTEAVSIMPGIIVELDEKADLHAVWIRPENGV